MGLLENETTIVEDSTQQVGQSSTINIGKHKKKDFFDVNKSNPFAPQDYHQIIKTYEAESTNWVEDDYALVTHYKDVYETRNFSERVRDQLDYYPGMHQSSSPPKQDPAYKNAAKMADKRQDFWNNSMASPDAFMNGLRSRQKDFDYTKIFGSDTSAKTKAQNLGKMLTECVPCFDRVFDKDSLLPDGDLLEIHGLNIKLRTDFLKKIRDLFRDPGAYLDICELLKLFSSICPQDLLAMLAVFTQYLSKLNLDIKFNFDFIISLIGPMLSPFLDGLSQWLDKWTQMILKPTICVIDHINEVILLAQSVKTSVNLTVNVDLNVEKVPPKKKYNPEPPKYPIEELKLSGEETKESWKSVKEGKLEDRDPEKRKELDARWKKSRDDYQKRQEDLLEKERERQRPERWNEPYRPPEKTGPGPVEPTKYFDPAPIVNSVVQLRNILQGAIQYMKDWFTYVTQMIYDLLGIELGWMSKKTGSSYLKTNLIAMIKFIQAILSAISKNGLECGSNSELTPEQLKHIIEDNLNDNSSYKFKVADDGGLTMLPPGGNPIAVKNNSEEEVGKKQDNIIPSAVGNVIEKPSTQAAMKEKAQESGIIIKSCLKDVSSEELSKVRNWIKEFERSFA